MIVGQTLGGFEVRRRLGKGGVGDVYLAFDAHLRRDVAIKALRSEFAHDPAFVRRFVGEAQNLARLNHPNIATLYSLHNDGRDLCMVMEYIDGQTLDEIAAACPLSEADAVAVAAQAMEGLRYAHAMGLIHRDIKPGNLMINRAGTLKIMDFGIARLQGSERMTRQGAIIGSIAYMAPEQILGREGDERSDIYSLAMVLYELLCGAPPFAGDSEYAVMKAQIETAPRRLFEHLPAIDTDLEAALMRALAKAPEDRFPTVDDFHSALAPVMTTSVDAMRRLNGRFAGQKEVREDDRAECGRRPAWDPSGSAAPERADQASSAPTPARTRLVDPPLLRRAIRVEWREVLPRVALGVAASIFAIVVGMTTLTDRSGTTGDAAAYPPASKSSEVESSRHPAAEKPAAGPSATAPARAPAAAPEHERPMTGIQSANTAITAPEPVQGHAPEGVRLPEPDADLETTTDPDPPVEDVLTIAEPPPPEPIPGKYQEMPDPKAPFVDVLTIAEPPPPEPIQEAQETPPHRTRANPWAGSFRQ